MFTIYLADNFITSFFQSYFYYFESYPLVIQIAIVLTTIAITATIIAYFSILYRRYSGWDRDRRLAKLNPILDNLITENIILNEEKTITIVTDLPNLETALSYFDKFLAQIATGKPFSNYKFYSFVITKDNFQIFYRTKALDEYLTFFDRNYQKQNQ